MRTAWLRRTRCVSSIGVAAFALAGCGDSSTGPTALGNAQLIAHFQTLAAMSQPLHADQLGLAERVLADGAPVGRGRISIGGATSSYSMIAEFNVNDTAGVRVDSLLTFMAWTGPDADTIVEVEEAPGEMAILVTDPVNLSPDLHTTETVVTTSRPGRRCAQPPGISFPVDSSCRIETIMMPMAVQLDNEPLPSVDFAIPAEPITAIRREFNDPTP